MILPVIWYYIAGCQSFKSKNLALIFGYQINVQVLAHSVAILMIVKWHSISREFFHAPPNCFMSCSIKLCPPHVHHTNEYLSDPLSELPGMRSLNQLLYKSQYTLFTLLRSPLISQGAYSTLASIDWKNPRTDNTATWNS